MGDENKHEDDKDQYGGTVLQIMVQLSRHASKTQQTNHLERREQAADALETNRTALQRYHTLQW